MQIKYPKYKEIGEFFKQSRIKAGISQEIVAKKLSYESAQMISNWERGLCLPPANKLHLLSELLKIPRKQIIQLFLDATERQLREDLRISDRKQAVSYDRSR